MTTGTATINANAPQINDLISWMRKNNCSARAACFLCHVLTQSAKWRSEIFILEFLTTTRARSSKFVILCFYVKTIRAKEAKVRFVCFVQSDQQGTNMKQPNAKFYFNVTFCLQRSLYPLELPIIENWGHWTGFEIYVWDLRHVSLCLLLQLNRKELTIKYGTNVW